MRIRNKIEKRMLSTSVFAFSKYNGKIISSRILGNRAMTVLLDLAQGLVLRLVVAQEQELFILYRSEADPEIGVNFY